jgi:hypothetical protein
VIKYDTALSPDVDSKLNLALKCSYQVGKAEICKTFSKSLTSVHHQNDQHIKTISIAQGAFITRTASIHIHCIAL